MYPENESLFFKLIIFPTTITVTADLTHQISQLVHGVGETLRLSLHSGVTTSFIPSEPELLEDGSHFIQSSRLSPLS